MFNSQLQKYKNKNHLHVMLVVSLPCCNTSSTSTYFKDNVKDISFVSTSWDIQSHHRGH